MINRIYRKIRLLKTLWSLRHKYNTNYTVLNTVERKLER